MSSVNPVFILPRALEENGVELGMAFIASLNTGVGQLCTSPGLVFAIDGEGLEPFLVSAAEAVRQSPAAPMLNSRIHSSYDAASMQFADSEGVTTLATGASDDSIIACGLTRLFVTDGTTFLADPQLSKEAFGAASLVVRVSDLNQMLEIARALEGQLTATVHAMPDDYAQAGALLPVLELLAGRIVFNGWPTGVEVGHAMTHGGPFPATSAPASTSVGSLAVDRFLRPVSYQNVPDNLLPRELRDQNPKSLWRRVNGVMGKH
jgi:NADP-dependent aldehyde dehydrogenase